MAIVLDLFVAAYENWAESFKTLNFIKGICSKIWQQRSELLKKREFSMTQSDQYPTHFPHHTTPAAK